MVRYVFSALLYGPSSARPVLRLIVSRGSTLPLVQTTDSEVIDRLTNAYPGATNSIGSIHQRRWLLSLDREASGFSRTPGASGSSWVRRARDAEVGGGKEADGGFVVRGRDVETSVLTGRNADEVMSDEGVEGFVGRRGWWPVVE